MTCSVLGNWVEEWGATHIIGAIFGAVMKNKQRDPASGEYVWTYGPRPGTLAAAPVLKRAHQGLSNGARSLT